MSQFPQSRRKDKEWWMQMPDLQTGRGTLNIINQLWIAYTNRTEQPFWQSGTTIFLKIMFDLELLIFSFESYFLNINILLKEHLLQAGSVWFRGNRRQHTYHLPYQPQLLHSNHMLTLWTYKACKMAQWVTVPAAKRTTRVGSLEP